MRETDSIASGHRDASGRVFISYASRDGKRALAICNDLEKRGVACWISTRDVAPGENYQEAIVQALRQSRAVVLVFSAAANSSDEIKKELSLASRYRIPVITLRLEAVEPSDAFAYELSTRQWIDAFRNRDKAIGQVVDRIAHAPPGGAAPAAASARAQSRLGVRSLVAIGLAGVITLAALAGWWWWPRSSTTAQSMLVRLSGFQILSPDLPPTIRAAVDSEIAAAFNADGVVGVSTASAPPSGSAPAYALGGTIQRDGSMIRVITRLTNERSGATLWTDNFNYDGNDAGRVPRHIAIDAGNVVRCGLFGASTYGKALPDPVLRDYLQFCQGHWDPNLTEGRKALVPAQRVVATVPDFSWGWAGVAGAYWKVAMNADTPQLTEQARASGRQAADRAIAIDSRNSEAFYIKSMLVDRHDWLTRENLLKRAVAARRLDCGCEHHQYGWMLLNVGRVAEALEQLRQADDMLALYVYTPLTLAQGLAVAGKPDEAKTYFDAAIDLSPNAKFAQDLQLYKAVETEDAKLLSDPALPIPAAKRAALLQSYRAAGSPDAGAKAKAVAALLALPKDDQDEAVVRLLARLGAEPQAFDLAKRVALAHEYPGASLFFYPSTRSLLADPGFPAVAAQLGLMRYWRVSHTKPDVCAQQGAPPFCRMI